MVRGGCGGQLVFYLSSKKSFLSSSKSHIVILLNSSFFNPLGLLLSFPPFLFPRSRGRAPVAASSRLASPAPVFLCPAPPLFRGRRRQDKRFRLRRDFLLLPGWTRNGCARNWHHRCEGLLRPGTVTATATATAGDTPRNKQTVRNL